MKQLLILTFCFFALATAVNAQTFTSTATITISRKSDGVGATQNKADRALMEDIERYVVGVAGAVVNPTEKICVWPYSHADSGWCIIEWKRARS